MAAQRSPGVLASVPVKGPSVPVLMAQLDHFSNTAGWRPSPNAPTAPQVMLILAPEGSQGHLLGTERSWESRPAAGRQSCGGRTGVECKNEVQAQHTESLHLRLTQGLMRAGQCGELRGQQADSTMYGMEGVGGPRF